MREALGLAAALAPAAVSERFASAEAFEALAAQRGGDVPAQPCCLLLDVRMPGMSGLALFERSPSAGWSTCCR